MDCQQDDLSWGRGAGPFSVSKVGLGDFIDWQEDDSGGRGLDPGRRPY